MAKKNRKLRDEFKGLKSWEIRYLQQAEKYGHLETKKQNKRRK